MKMRITVLSPRIEEQRDWFRAFDFLKNLGEGFELSDRPGKTDEAEAFFISPSYSGLDQHLLEVGRKNKCVILVLDPTEAQPQKVSEWLKNSWIDDVIVSPFREVEILSRIREAERLFLWHEVETVNGAMSEMVSKLKDDLALAERIQKARLPIKFDGLKGLTIRSRYLAGIRPGGDYFDVVESQNRTQVSFLLTDSSNYGLSSALLGVLIKVAAKMNSDGQDSALEVVRRIYSEIELTLSDKDKLSLFYGIFNRKDYTLKYISLGGVSSFVSKPGQPFVELPQQGDSIVKYSGIAKVEEGMIELGFEDRLALISDGFIELGGGVQGVADALNSKRNDDVLDSLNELTYRVKTGTGEYDEMPAQDCTGLLVQFERQLIRLKI